MKLSASLVVGKVEKRCNVTYGKVLSREPVLERPLLYADDSEFNSDTMYIMSGDQYIAAAGLSVPEGCLILVVSSVKMERPSAVGVCIAETTMNVPAFFNYVNSVYDYFDDWYGSLMSSRLAGNSIRELLEISAPVFARPLVVIGMDFSVIASVETEHTIFSENYLGSTDESYRFVNELKRDTVFTEIREYDGCFVYTTPKEDQMMMCVNIKQHGETACRLMMIFESDTIDDSYGFLLEHLAGIIEHAYTHSVAQRPEKDRARESVFLTLLGDKTADYVTVSRALDAGGWYSSHLYFAVVLKLGHLDKKHTTVNSITSYIENAIPHSCSVEFRGDVVVFINVTLIGSAYNACMERLSYFVRDSFLRAGYSRTMVGHFNLRRQYLQALIAYDIGNRKNPTKWIHRYNDISYDYVLEQATSRLPGYMVGHESVLKLKYYDDDNRTRYIETLRTFLDNNQNAVKTARDLFIHRSTLLYRIEKIKELLNTDFDDPNEVLYMNLTLRFLELDDASH